MVISYTIWLFNIAMGQIPYKWRFLAGKIIYKWAMASMAMLNNQRLNITNITPNNALIGSMKIVKSIKNL